MAAIAAVVGACTLCILGPAFFLSVTAAATGWFAGLQPVLALGLGLLVVFALYRLWLAWGARDAARTGSSEGEVS